MTEGLSTNFAAEFPEIANIFSNRDMMRDHINDIRTTTLFPTWEEKHKEIYYMRREVL